MADVASIFLSPLLQVFFERVASPEFVDLFRGKKLDQDLLNELKMALISANAVFEDAEEKQVANSHVKTWLDELKDAVYDAEDLLDDINTEAMRCKLDAEFPTSTCKKVRKAISTTLKPFVKEIEPKIKQVLDRLKRLIRQKKDIGLQEGVHETSSERLPTTSLVEDSSGIFGREDDKETIIKYLLPDHVSGNQLFHVIAIVGTGGVGKTTLAQLVYNDKRVKEYFDLKIWVCVSDDFDVFKVTKAILKRVDSSANGDGETLDWLQTKLKESLTGKKFLIVLDDVWNDISMKWEILSKPFRFGTQGSKVLVSTRQERVASVMQATLIHHLELLPKKECWSLFARHAFRSISDMDPELEAIGRQIVEKCKGLPLAAKTIGSLLWSRVGVDDWKRILWSELWDTQIEINPALKLSYKYLPTHLKRCFAYCSIFPKDYFFSKDELVLLWMAEGFLQKSNGRTMEQVGDDYFFDLVSRSLLFQQSSVYHDSKFGMHDLVNDLAKFVSGQFIFRLEGGNSLEVTDRTRHLSIVGRKIENVSKKLQEGGLDEAKGLRTFLIRDDYFPSRAITTKSAHDLLSMLRLLRVLSFKCNKSLTELPDSIDKIRHLRYLNLSSTQIRKLPDSICKLCNLQTLMLRGCRELAALPRDMHKLVSLRHLTLDGTEIMEMPLDLGRLKCLQTLDAFVVNKNCGSIIGELGKLEDIGGKLAIRNLQNVKSPADASDASLKDKKHLNYLELVWHNHISESPITVLENLKPHTNLESLAIRNYGGKSFPDWIAHHSFSKMKYLELYKCIYCLILPSFGQLHSLKSLIIDGFYAIASVGKEFYGNGSSTFKPFEALEVLNFRCMPNWENWSCFDSENEVKAFPRLKELEIVSCPKLTGRLPIHLPSLTRLVIDKCSKLAASLPRSPTLLQLKLTNVNEVQLNDFPSGLKKVVLKECGGLQSLPEGMMDSSSPLQELKIDGCSSLMLLSDDGLNDFPSGLKKVVLKECGGLQSLPEGMMDSRSPLQELEIDGCRSLMLLSEDGLNDFPSGLKKVVLKKCGGLQSLPEGMMDSNSPLQELEIDGCSSLVLLSNNGLPSTLETLKISNWKKLEFPVHFNYSSLKELYLKNSCDSLRSFPMNLIAKIDRFTIDGCENLESLTDSEQHEIDSAVSIIKIMNCPNFVSFLDGGLRVQKLKILTIYRCGRLRSLPDKMHLLLPSLNSLEMRWCPMLQSFGEGGLPTNLKSIYIQDCDKFVASRTTWDLQELPSLRELDIHSQCEDVESFPVPALLPKTLESLSISGFTNMTSVDKKAFQHLKVLKNLCIKELPRMTSLDKLGLRHLTSLQRVTISDCRNLKFLPKDGFPASISSLKIFGCPLLEKQLQNKKGKEWRKVAHIPSVVVIP